MVSSAARLPWPGTYGFTEYLQITVISKTHLFDFYIENGDVGGPFDFEGASAMLVILDRS
jgi:hypothetical protein